MKFNRYKNLHIILLASIGLLMAISSCKKMVEIDQPINTITEAQVFSTDAQANSFLAGCYSQLMSNNGTMTFSNGGTSIYAGLSADELVSYAGVGGIADMYQFETNKLASTNSVVNSVFWAPAYHLINSVNTIIEDAPASASALLTDSTRTQIVGESKFIRAFSYFYLTNIFGNVPLALSTDFNKTSVLTNASQQDVYAQITKDLLDAQAVLKTDYSISKAERIRANKWAATALLARVYLYQKKWTDAETQATSIIGNSQFSLIKPSVTVPFTTVFNKNSTEAILQFQQNATVLPRAGTYEAINFIPQFSIYATPATWPTYFGVFTTYAALLYPTYYMTPQLANTFEANDLRKSGLTGFTPSPPAAPYNGVYSYWPQKYTVNASSVQTAVTQYYMVLRLAEQYLIRAEARAQQNNLSGALSDLNVIRTRAGLPASTAASQADILTAIMHERQVELFSEWGHRFFDLKRTGQAAAVLGAITTKPQPFNANQLLYPIPQTELNADGFLIQNPGY